MSRKLAFGIIVSIAVQVFRAPAVHAVELFKPKQKAAPAISATSARLKEMDQAMDSFAERYSSYLQEAVERAVEGNPDPDVQKQAMRLKLHATSSAYDIACGPNPLGQLLDMCVLVTLGKINWVEEGRAKRIFGSDRGKPVVQAFDDAYDEIWSIAAKFLTPDEIAATKKLTRSWRAKHPDLANLQDIRFDDFARARAGLEQDNPAIKGLFAQLGEATRSIQSAQDFGERTLFYVKHMPRILQFQTERTAQALLENPDIKESVSSASQISASIAHIVDRFDAEQTQMQTTLQEANKITENGRLLVGEVREAGTALTETFDAANRLTLTLNPPPKPGETAKREGKPFDINEYTLVFEKEAIAARESRLLVEQTMALESAPLLNNRIDEVEGFMKRRVDHIAIRSGQVIAFFFTMLLLTRWASRALKLK